MLRTLWNMFLLVPLLLSTMVPVQANGPFPCLLHIDKLPVAMIGPLTGAFSGLTWNNGSYWTHTDDAGAGPDRTIYLVRMNINAGFAEIVESIALRDEQGVPVTGVTLDPEDIAVAPDGTFWLSDERYPIIFQVSRDGQILRRVNPPDRFFARTSGRGFEGLTISPDGQTIYVILQTGLITEPDKSHTWLLAYDTTTGEFQEHSYHLDRPADFAYPIGIKPFIGASGLLYVSPSTLLVLERDNQSGGNIRQKRIYRVTLPAVPDGKPLRKELAVDLAALGYRMEKVEGLAMPNSTTLVLINDNDGNADRPTVVWHMQYHGIDCF